MKNIFLGIATFSLFIFSSCSKDVEASALELDQSKTATVHGVVNADLDLTSAGYENAPSGTKILIAIDNAEYLSGATGTTMYETTVSEGGNFSINLPVNENGIQANFFPSDFEYDQVTDGDDERVIYTAAPFSVTMYPGGAYIRDIQYN